MTWAAEAPERVLYSTDTAGGRELRSLDRSTGADRLVTDEPTGVAATKYPWATGLGVLTPGGEGVVRFASGGDERGGFVVTPFSGGDSVPLAPDLPPGSPIGFSVRADRVAVGMENADGYSISVVEGGRARTIVERDRPVAVAGLSADAELLALTHTEHGDFPHPRVEVVDPRDGRWVADAFDGPGNTIKAAGVVTRPR